MVENFTPVSGLIGGLLIGLAAALLLLLNGRISGISGIVGGLVTPKSPDAGWRIAFVAGLLLGGAALFGVGWGLSGFCLGPAVAALTTGLAPVIAFVAAMIAGMVLYAWVFEQPDRGRLRANAEGPQTSWGRYLRE
jgi:uncharacterized membrane protein YedE/YeeE